VKEMDIQELLAEVKGERTHYVPCNMPLSLFERFDAIAKQAEVSRSKLLVVATRLLVQSYDGAGSPREGIEAMSEGGDEVEAIA